MVERLKANILKTSIKSDSLLLDKQEFNWIDVSSHGEMSQFIQNYVLPTSTIEQIINKNNSSEKDSSRTW